MTMESLPTILFQAGGVDVGDLEFIQGKVESGDYFHVLTDISIATNLATFTVPDGKTAFLIEAKITMIANPGISSNGTVSDQIVGTLQKNINTVITEFSKAKIGGISAVFRGVREPGGAGLGLGGYCPFNVLGFSLLGSGVLNKIEIKNTVDGGNAFGEFSGYLV